MKKNYIVDTNVLIDNPNSLQILRNGEENEIFLSLYVILELDNLKTHKKIGGSVREAIQNIIECKDWIHITYDDNSIAEFERQFDGKIIKELNSNKKDKILISNDKIMRLIAEKVYNIKCDEFQDANPYLTNSEAYTGFIEVEDSERTNYIINSFYWENGKPVFNSVDGPKVIGYENIVWKIKPRNIYQNLAFELLINNSINIVTLQSQAGYGKAQPLDSKILTDVGWKLMRDIQIGDNVATVDGTFTRVINIYPQGELDIYKVSFNDDSSTECCEEHLWTTQTANDRHSKNNRWKTYDLKQIKQMGLKNSSNKRKHFIPMVKPIQFKDKKLLLDPYIMGCIIGDGCYSCPVNITFVTQDNEIIDAMYEYLPETVTLKKVKYTKGNCTTYRFVNTLKPNGYYEKGKTYNSLAQIFEYYSLRGGKSNNKFIPDVYKFNSIHNRTRLLQGLMDTDGTINKKSKLISFSSSSKQLLDDVKFLVHSLGGKTQKFDRMGKYRKNGIIKETQMSYTIHITLPSDIIPFTLKRKLDIFNSIKKYEPNRAINKIEYIGKKEAQCIMVEHPSQLYVTDDCIVTHNTFLALAAAFHLCFQEKKFKKIIVTKGNYEIDKELGSLPGDLDDKFKPIIRPITDLVYKLHKIKPANRLFIKDSEEKKFDINRIEFLPLNFIQGMNLEDCILIIDEGQNLTRKTMRTVSTRCGENTRLFVIGDTRQVINPFINEYNNGLNWLVKLCAGQPDYGHLVLKGKNSRGPVTDLILKVGL